VLVPIHTVSPIERKPSPQEVFAAQNRIEKIVAKHHANKRVTLRLIELAGHNPAAGGSVYVLTEAGEAFVVENGLYEQDA
jgi:hypothetical protein